jgi:hypothetical protein
MKLKRKPIAEKYEGEIEELYGSWGPIPEPPQTALESPRASERARCVGLCVGQPRRRHLPGAPRTSEAVLLDEEGNETNAKRLLFSQ